MDHPLADRVRAAIVANKVIDKKVEDKLGIAAAVVPSARQQIVLDALSGHQLDIMELFKRNGMDSQDQIHAWRDLLIMFTPT